MPHSPAERKRVVTRLRRIKGQAEALERAVEAGTECVDLLQQLAALRGATYGLMADVLESHMRETFGTAVASSQARQPPPDQDAEVDHMVRMLRSFLR
ncbi:metal/formaldehyde-sensitive transcriptional repressor [Ideonella sp. B508-1]|uniref:metal/formaldehyde-sensitive transcriptional repressor n=1 Tax=Ideonella sp. B508-1 TaxID=137716 RepID=UPI0003484FD8|nr:metal/formaldehyde-sensitive transcriptional repressor [Ideonella sp. B508-1]